MNVAKLNEMDDLKSNEMKAKWRSFCEEFKHVEDYSFATLVRLDSRYDMKNDTLIPQDFTVQCGDKNLVILERCQSKVQTRVKCRSARVSARVLKNDKVVYFEMMKSILIQSVNLALKN